MSKKGLLNPQFNRVRTSNALKTNDMWEKVVGVTEETGHNEAIEAAIRAPTRGGMDKDARRERAQAIIDASGYKPVVTDYQGLMNLARAQGGIGNMSRGACKLCGGLGHRTKQCTNFLSGHSGATGDCDIVVGAAAGSAARLGLLPEPDAAEDSDLDLSGLDSDSSSSGSGSDGSSDSDSDGGRKRKRSSSSSSKDKKKKKHKRDSKSEKKSKKGKKDDREKKHKKKKDKKEKRSRH